MKNENDLVKKAGDEPILISDYKKKQLQNFINEDNRDDLLFFEVIQQSDRDELEILERVLLKTFDHIRDTMITSDFYTKKDLSRINFLLYSVKMNLSHVDFSVDLNPVLDGFGMGRVNI